MAIESLTVSGENSILSVGTTTTINGIAMIAPDSNFLLQGGGVLELAGETILDGRLAIVDASSALNTGAFAIDNG